MLKASNSLIKDLKKQKRENSSLLFLDNKKIINDAIAHGLVPKIILIEKEEFNFWSNICPVYLADRKTIEQLSDCVTPQGVLCITEYIQDMEISEPKSNFLVLDTLQDPGNVGTLIRSAAACKFQEIFLLDSVKITNSKLIRSSVGTIFNVKIHSLTKEKFIQIAKNWNQTVFLKADMNGEDVFSTKFDHKYGLILGNEGKGVSKILSKLCTKTIALPMENCVESLNVAVSGAVIMYQIYSQSRI